MDSAKRDTLRSILVGVGVAVTTPLALVSDSEPWERLATGKPSSINAASIAHFRGLMKNCWELSNTGELGAVENILVQFLPRLEALAPHQAEVADIASMGLQLKSILVAHRLKLADKIALCQQSISYVREASDGNTLVAGLAQLAIAYQYAGQYTEALATYQEALKSSPQVSPLLLSRVYVEYAAMLAKHGRKKEGHFYMDLAEETYPAFPQNDPSFLFADCSSAILSLYEGLAYLNMGQPMDAWNSFEKYQGRGFGETVPERIRLEIVNHQGRAALQLGDLDKYVACLKDGVQGAITLKSKKRYNEALTIFQHDVPDPWRREPQLRAVVEQFALSYEG